jgi:hypothetical protein
MFSFFGFGGGLLSIQGLQSFILPDHYILGMIEIYILKVILEELRLHLQHFQASCFLNIVGNFQTLLMHEKIVLIIIN